MDFGTDLRLDAESDSEDEDQEDEEESNTTDHTSTTSQPIAQLDESERIPLKTLDNIVMIAKRKQVQISTKLKDFPSPSLKNFHFIRKATNLS